MRLNRRRAIALGLGSVGALVGARCALPALLRHQPPTALPPDLQAQVDALFADVDRKKVWDTHVHLVGRGHGTDCAVSPELTSRLHPWKNLQFDIYAAASGLSLDDDTPDSAYLDRLLALHRLANPQGKLVLLAFDRFVDDSGAEQPDKSELFTPNEYVLEVARKNPDVIACCSVHPYRKDAVARVERAIAGGARAMKWLPNAMGIDASDARCDPVYEVLAKHRVPLIVHTGDEQAVDARELQKLGDPRRLVRALEHGVTVVAAHVATTGSCGADASDGCFRALLAMMQDDRWRSLLYADISAVAQRNRAGPDLVAILGDDALQARLVNGSDYPLPAIDPLVSTRYLVRHGFLSDEDRNLCNRVFAHNPLLFDYVLKRKLRVIDEASKREQRFLPRVFETSWLFSLS
ncbi:MAG TPA: amidohydrolase family protein [Myxococcota bacterium]|jgi:mannonate dehydratase